MQDQYDQAFLGILQHEGDLTKFLDVFFSFLYRKTDFFIHLTPSKGSMGFPPGTAQKIILSAYKSYEKRAAPDNEKRRLRYEKEIQEQHEKMAKASAGSVPGVARTEEVSTAGAAVDAKLDSRHSDVKKLEPSSELAQAMSRAKESAKRCTPDIHPTEPPPATGLPETPQHEPSIGDKPVDPTAAAKPETSANGDSGAPADEDLEQTRLQKVFQANPESYNGAIRDCYSWSQTITDVDMRIKVPKHVVRGKDVAVEIGRKNVKASFRDVDGQMITVIDGPLTWDINKEQSMWTLVPKEYIHVNFEKVQERWWEAVLEDEAKISVRKIDPSRPMTDLGDEEQAKIEEMMFNERQKCLGLPQSHEKKVHDMLRDAWDKEGSPFKGQPFDLSKVNVSPGSTM